jgi:Flp pilus assembly protein TadG
VTGRQRGQATVELALGLPVVLLAVLLVVQVGLVVADQVRVVHAAREAARVAAVDARAAEARRAALAAAGLDPDRSSVRVLGRGPPGQQVRVVVTYRAPTVVPLAGPLLPDITLRARAAMRVER